MERLVSSAEGELPAGLATGGRLTRRQAIGHGFAAGIGLAIARSGQTRASQSPTATELEYARPELLIEPATLRERAVVPTRTLRQESPLSSADRLLVVALATADEHAAGRLPGAAQIDWPELEVIDTSDASIARWRADLERIVTALGITPDREVVAYDVGTLFAARLWWVLSYLGHDRVSLLHGGLAAWDAAGGEVASGRLKTAEAAPSGEPYRSRPRDAMLAQAARVRALIGEPTVALVDARSSEEYAAGHIPGAVNISYLGNVEAGPPLWLPAAELRAIYAALGVTPDKLVIPYCTSGVRSAVTFFTLRLLGFPNVALYTGSWQEWETLPGAPVTTGDLP